MPIGLTPSRQRILGLLSASVESAEPQIVLVTGAPGSGKTYLVSDALAGRRGVHFCPPGLTDTGHRALFAHELTAATQEDPELSLQALVPRTGSWETLLEAALRAPNRFLVIDGLGSVVRANRQFFSVLAASWRSAALRGERFLLVLIDDDLAALQAVTAKNSPFRDPLERAVGASEPATWITLASLPYTVLERPAADRTEAWLRVATVFGGRPAVLRYVDPARSVGDNCRSLVLNPDGPLWDEPLRAWQGTLKHAGRYGSICSALASGARVWAELPEFMGDDTAASSVGPYVKRLLELGRVTGERSLDSKRRSRGQRYRLSDAFDAFWWNAVLPLRSGLLSRRIRSDEAWRHIAGHAFSDHVSQTFPLLCRQFLENASDGILGATARAAGGLWGEGYEIPVAATLQNGAVVYGVCHTDPVPMTDVALDRLEEQMRNTRYGFGREARIRALFSLSGFSQALVQRASRDPLVQLIGPVELATST